MLRVYSVALFRAEASAYEKPEAGAGRGVFFRGFLPTLLRAVRSCFDGWHLVIHHDPRVMEWPYFRVLEALHERGMLTLVARGNAYTLCGSMLWRLCPIFEGATHVVCRDVDSLPTPRERAAVERWINSGKPVHAMHDSPSHRATPLLGGMVGFHGPWFREHVAESWGAVIGQCKAYGINLDEHGADQRWLNQQVWPLVKDGLCRYDTPETMGIPTEGRDLCGGHARHVGGAYHAGPVADWYNIHYPDPAVLEAEKEAGWLG